MRLKIVSIVGVGRFLFRPILNGFFPQSFKHNLNKACTVLVRVDLLPDVKCSIDGRCIFMKDNLCYF